MSAKKSTTTWEETSMFRASTIILALGITTALGSASFAQTPVDPNGAPNPYRLDENWLKTPEGRKIGQVTGVDIDPDGKSIWVFDRCGVKDCANSTLDPIEKFDASGKLVTGFGKGLFNHPHGFYVDRGGNVWTTDNTGANGKGHQVIKFSPQGKVLLTLGKSGVAGEGPDEFNAPTDVAVAANGDIIVSDGHGGKTNARIVKFTPDGKFIKAWGKLGSAPGEFNVPHGLAFDSAGRLFVADRANSRLQVFDQDGKFIDQWKQFGRPSGVWIDKNDQVYVADSQSNDKTNPGFKQGIRIGNAKDGKVTGFIEESEFVGSLEGVGVDDKGNIFAGYTGSQNLRRFVKKETQ
jgi:DNA-binding beta-propeller fold protein YncE